MVSPENAGRPDQQTQADSSGERGPALPSVQDEKHAGEEEPHRGVAAHERAAVEGCADFERPDEGLSTPEENGLVGPWPAYQVLEDNVDEKARSDHRNREDVEARKAPRGVLRVDKGKQKPEESAGDERE